MRMKRSKNDGDTSMNRKKPNWHEKNIYTHTIKNDEIHLNPK